MCVVRSCASGPLLARCMDFVNHDPRAVHMLSIVHRPHVEAGACSMQHTMDPCRMLAACAREDDATSHECAFAHIQHCGLDRLAAYGASLCALCSTRSAGVSGPN
uniref:Uncharacterized protein n=1 Tax=Haptolina ericina TaxID=156174 RepID=A0A7S3BNM8_9EUKA